LKGGARLTSHVSMDDLARHYYRLKFENDYLRRRGDTFQDFFADIMEKAHPGDFIRVRPWGNVGDRKNDGYLRSARMLFQVYAPNEMAAAEAIKKINEDFAGALPHWRQYFDTWVFVHNSEMGLGPEVTAKLLELSATHPEVKVTSWGMEELRQKVFELSDDGLAALLGPAPTRAGLVDLGLESLAPVLDQIARLPAPANPDLRPPPADKIEVNMLSAHVAVLLKAGMSRAPLVRQYFVRATNKLDELAESFRARYTQLRDEGGSPDQVFADLQAFAGGTGVQQPAKQEAVLAVLAFFFEECEIYERVAVPEPGGAD
jgi:hypothetical protein